MSKNLITAISEFLSPVIMNRIAAALGLDLQSTQNAVRVAVPSLLSSLTNVAATPDGVRRLSEAIADQKPEMLEGFKIMICGRRQKDLAESGFHLMVSVLGSNTAEAIGVALSRFLGIGQDVSGKLLAFLAPIVLGVMGKELRRELDASRLAQFRSSQMSEVPEAALANFTPLGDSAPSGIPSWAGASYAEAAAIAHRLGQRSVRTTRDARYLAITENRNLRPEPTPLVSASRRQGHLYLVYDIPIVWPANDGAGARGDPRSWRGYQATRKGHQKRGGVRGRATVRGHRGGYRQRIHRLLSSVQTDIVKRQGLRLRPGGALQFAGLANQLEKLSGQAKQSPAEDRMDFAGFASSAMTKLNGLLDEILKILGASAVGKVVIDGLRSKLNALAATA